MLLALKVTVIFFKSLILRRGKGNKKNMKAAIGRKLAGNVMKTWTEDFVDEDTGEVVSIERNKVVVERETVITEETVEQNS